MSELPLALEVDYFRVAKDRYFVPISVKIPGSAVGLTKKGAKQTADLDFIGQVRDAAGKLVTGVRDNITVKLNEGDAAQIGQPPPAIRHRADARARHLHPAIPGARKSERQDGHLRNQVHRARSEFREDAARQLRDLLGTFTANLNFAGTLSAQRA